MSSVLVYALHYDGAINKNSLGAVSEGARLAGELGGEAHAIVVGGADLTDDLLAGARQLRRVEGATRSMDPKASPSRSSTRWPRSSMRTATSTPCSAVDCSASRSEPAWQRG